MAFPTHERPASNVPPGEARGADWQDLDGSTLKVRHSVWRTHTTAPKTDGSAKSVTVVEPLRSILAELREEEVPDCGPILRGDRGGKPLNLENLARRVVVPVLGKTPNAPLARLVCSATRHRDAGHERGQG